MLHKSYIAHQQTRWLRPDAARWVRPDAARFLKPGTRPEDVFPVLALKYNPNQPRVPAGHSDGGQWTDEDGAPSHLMESQPAAPDERINDPRVISDADPEVVKPGEQYAQVIRICIASGIAQSTDQMGKSKL